MEETDGRTGRGAGASVRRYLGGSGNFRYSLKNINEALVVLLRDHVRSLSAKQKDMGFAMCTLCPGICCENPQTDALS